MYYTITRYKKKKLNSRVTINISSSKT